MQGKPIKNRDFENKAGPFLKWPGGKRWASVRIAAIAQAHLTGCYFEPFLGSGAVFFYLRPSRAVLSDLNVDLVDTYAAVRDDWTEILLHLRKMPVSRDEFLRIRASKPRGRFTRAARFLYLNRTAFGGIYRLNRKGEFNVPFGGRTPNILWEKHLLAAAAAPLQRAEVVPSDFEPMLDRAGLGDVVYCDPAYTVAHDNNGFIRYNEANFSWSDQERLAKAAYRARERGACVIVTNAFHRDVRELYPSAKATVLKRLSRVASRPEARRPVSEYLFQL